MTGDSERTAAVIAKKVGVDEYYSEVLPEDKAGFIEKEKAKGKKVLMVGDGVNDSPALSAADAGIAVSDGAELAREIADITISAENLYQIVRLKYLSHAMMKRINRNYRAGIAVSDGAELAREIADITISAENLYQIVRLKYLSHAMMKRINRNYREIVGINTLLILLGVGGVIQPTATAMLHNISTIAIGLKSMKNLPETEEI